ncbi:MAG: acyl--CoA ligase [Caulobacteraceae bacterium]|nr:acyl--CoA ligase [Caulobacteraceae bacterium]
MHYAELKRAWTELTAPGAPFEIAIVEVGGIALRAYRHAPPDIRALWLSTGAFADRTYLVYRGERLTYGQAHAQADAIAGWLAARGVASGDRVAIAMRNYPEWLLVYWACVSMGVAVVGMNAWWVAEEMDYAIRDCAPKAIFCDPERLARIAECPGLTDGIEVVVTRLDEPPPGSVAWSEVIGSDLAMPAADIDPDADACIFYTSGTTGFPKGARLTHRGCLANLMSMAFSGQVQALATMRATGVQPDPGAPVPIPIALLPTPLFHVTANNCAAYAVTAAGGTLVLMHRWDPGEALELIERERVTAFAGVPVMARELIGHPDLPRRDTSSLLTLGGGGAQLQPDLVGRIDAEVATARPNTGYGMTETCGIITAVAADFFIDKPDSCGPAMPCYEYKCVDDEGRAVPPGALGELWVRGVQVIKGYLNRPEETAQAITDGWLHTGDVARVDEDGFIFIVDRKKDMVLRGGENVYCAEVEASIHRHPAVAECCVFGVVDERLGEEVGAAIVLRAGENLGPRELRAHCEGIMARHKIPRYLWFLADPIPRNASGKFLKRQLRESLSVEEAG